VASVLKPGVALTRRRLSPGETLVERGKPGDDLFVVLVGSLDVEVDGETIGRVGAGAVVGERAIVEGGVRTATLRARTHSCVAVIAPADVDRAKLAALSASRP
jgi:CRP-like cAMP-binding protein